MTADKFIDNCNGLLKMTNDWKKDLLLSDFVQINKEVQDNKAQIETEELNKEEDLGGELYKDEEPEEALDLLKQLEDFRRNL